MEKNEIKLLNSLNRLKNVNKKTDCFIDLLDLYLKKQKFNELKNLLDNFDNFLNDNNLKNKFIDLHFYYGSLYFYTNENDQSLNHFLKALTLCYEQPERPYLSKLLFMIAGIYYKVQDAEKTLEYSFKALEIAKEEKNYAQIINIYSCLARVYLDTEDTDKALEFLKNAQILSNEKNIKDFDFVINYNLAILYHWNMNDQLTALDFINKAIEVAPQNNLISAFLTKASIYGELKRFQDCIDLYHEIIKKSDQHNMLDTKVMALHNLSKIYEQCADFENAYNTYKEFYELETKRNRELYKLSTEELKTKFELLQNEKEKEIYKLKNIDLKNSLKKSQKLSKQLNDKNLENERLIRILTQELSNPLNAIITTNNLITNKSLDSENQLHFKSIQTMTNSILNTISHVKELLSIESGKINVELKNVQLFKIIEQTRIIFQNIATLKNVDIVVESDTDIRDLYVRVEPVSFQDCIINNLLSNSIKYSFENSTVYIKIKKSHEWVTIDISDEGTGIKSKNLKALLSGKCIDITKGTFGESGFGLSMKLIHKYIKYYNGKIEIFSKHIDKYPNTHGTTVRLHVLRAEPAKSKR